MRIPLEPDAVALLRAALEKHAPQFLDEIRDDASIDLPNLDVANEVRSAVGDELSASGFDQDWEPNARGLELEALIDKLGEPFM